MRYNQRNIVSVIAKQRIQILYDMASENAVKNPDLSKNYIRELKRISAHCRQKLPKYIKNKICKSCGSFLIGGFNSYVRLSNKKYIVILCNCGKQKHIFYKK